MEYQGFGNKYRVGDEFECFDAPNIVFVVTRVDGFNFWYKEK